MVSVSPGDKKEQLGHFSQSWETRCCARPRPPPGRLPACPVCDVPRRRCLLRAVRSLPRLCGHSHTRTPRSCPLWPAHRRVGNTAPTEKEGDRKPRGVRFCQVCLQAPTPSPEPRDHALPQTYGVSHPRARGKAHPKLGALRIRPGGRLAPWLRLGLPSGLSLRLQAAAAAARPKYAGKREGTVSGGGPAPSSIATLPSRSGPHLTVLGLKFPHVAAGPGPPAALSGARPRFRARGGWIVRGERLVKPGSRTGQSDEAWPGSGRTNSESARPRRGFNSSSRSAPRGRGPERTGRLCFGTLLGGWEPKRLHSTVLHITKETHRGY